MSNVTFFIFWRSLRKERLCKVDKTETRERTRRGLGKNKGSGVGRNSSIGTWGGDGSSRP